MSTLSHSSSTSLPTMPSPPSDNIEHLKSLLKQPLRIAVEDGRVFLGTFAGTDKQLNVILVNTDEFRPAAGYQDANPNGRFVGQVMIPWRLVRRVEARSGSGGLRLPDSDGDAVYA
ncbi:N-alpha-acetyltransferase 38, NatC auxiliary subunit [Grifola frondosa]|uniref:N-alpha-acetyltransferase 38, NatC auxiliary subunit n=1 Tax=Grifola frondosa TaxID=5627 RepID=A0A1C7MTA1_GRIFR|nr:N-alpha-acetyltransferase 38, NatC auxiliary subunit [Grifola frondosa]